MSQGKLFNNSRDHVAIMTPVWGMIPKIIKSEKTIETRWYKQKSAPWDNIFEGDRIYFKDSGSLVTVRAEVGRVRQIENLNPAKIKDFLYKIAKDDGLGTDGKKLEEFYDRFKDKKYVILIELKNPIEIDPFEINKSGFGAMTAWITVDDISKIKK